VELLSVETRICEVTAITNRRMQHPLPLQGLMLPEIEGLRAEPVLILPAYIFVPGDTLKINYADQEQLVALSALDECLGIFAHFHFKDVNPEDKKKDDDGFADLWGAL
jgi:hypothetical protein